MSNNSFLDTEDVALGEQFLADGFVIRPSESHENLENLRSVVTHGAMTGSKRMVSQRQSWSYSNHI